MLHRALIVVVFFAAVAPILTWMDFSGGMENFNVETALEMVRDGHWLLPTLNGELRTKKPPLAEWTTAWGIMSSRSLAWGARWPTLLAGCLTLVGVYELGRLAGGVKLALIAAMVCGSSVLFLKWTREASYDMQLALWVTWTNVFLARAVLLNQWWSGCIGAGVCLGLALMTKGPPAVLQTVIPLLVARSPSTLFGRRPKRRVLAPAVVGLLLMLAVALPWTLYVMHKVPHRIGEWYGEVTLASEARLEHRVGGWFAYFMIVPLMLPWAVWFVGGLWMAGRQWIADWKHTEFSTTRGDRPAIRLMFVWFVVPLAVMWFFPERRDRYVLPLLGPAAVLSGWALLKYFSSMANEDAIRRWPLAVHWICLAIIAILFPVVEACLPWLRTTEGEPWLSPALAALGVAVGTVLIAGTMRLRKPSAPLLVGGTTAVMLAVLPFFVWGYARSEKGRAESKPFVEAILQQYPDAVVYNANNRPRRDEVPIEMLIYLNRPTPRAFHPEQLAPAEHPQVIVFPDGSCHPPPNFVRAAPRVRIKGEWWNAFALPAKGGS